MKELIPSLNWTHFVYFAIPCMLVLFASAWAGFKQKRRLAIALSVLALLILGVFIAGMWLSLERPPLRTMGETRLWYSFFVIIAGLITYVRWRYIVILGFSGILSSVFMFVNIFKPEIHNKTMMPALESPYFVPMLYLTFLPMLSWGQACLSAYIYGTKSVEIRPSMLVYY